MTKLTKNRKAVLDLVDKEKSYTLKEASVLVKELTKTKFDASVDIDVRLGIDPRKSNQMVRGIVSLPHGTGKETRTTPASIAATPNGCAPITRPRPPCSTTWRARRTTTAAA